MAPANTHTYDKTSRADGSGSAWAFKTVQMAIDSMSKGDTVQMRGGTYQNGRTTIPSSKVGTSWTNGNFNTLMSYPGEWAILDGEAKEACVIYGTTAKYWDFYNFEVKRGVSEDSLDAHGLLFYSSPLKLRWLYVHDNIAKWSGNNPSGIAIYTPQSSIVEYCYFKNNGNTDMIQYNGSHLQFFSDYMIEPIELDGFQVSSNDGNHMMKNIVRYNYFGDSAYFGFKQKSHQFFSGRNKANGHSLQDTFCTYGDDISYNIFKSNMVGMNTNQDFVQVHHNIIDCQLGVLQSQSFGDYKPVFYNNYMKMGFVLNNSLWINTISPAFSPDSNMFCYYYNNIIDSAQSWSDAQDFNVNSVSGLFDSLKIKNNWSYKAQSNSSDPSGDLFILSNDFTNVTKYTIAQFESALPTFSQYFNQTSTSIWQGSTGPSHYKTQGDFVISGTTTIANGGIGGTHPYLDGDWFGRSTDYDGNPVPNITLPSYLGASDPTTEASNLWIDTVLGLPAYFASMDTSMDTSSAASTLIDTTTCGSSHTYLAKSDAGYQFDSVSVDSGSGTATKLTDTTFSVEGESSQSKYTAWFSEVQSVIPSPDIDSIKNRIVLRGKRFTVHGKDFGSSIGTVKINSLTCGIVQWFDNVENDSVWATIPINAPAGLYTKSIITSAVAGSKPDTSVSIRVSVPTPTIGKPL